MPAPSDVNLLRWRQHARWKGNSTQLCFWTPITISQEYSLSTILVQVQNPIHPGLPVFADTGSCYTMTSSCIIPSSCFWSHNLARPLIPFLSGLPQWIPNPLLLKGQGWPWSTVLPILKELSRSLHDRAWLFYLNSSVLNLHIFLVNCGCQTL